jgi:hypothetical protein
MSVTTTETTMEAAMPSPLEKKKNIGHARLRPNQRLE